MKAMPNSRRGLILVLVIVVTALIGGGLAVLTAWAAEGYRTRQADRARLTARALTDSAAAYARAHLEEWSTRAPTQPVTLDVSALLLPNMTGSATITFETIDGRAVCHATGAAQVGPSTAMDEIDLDMPSSAARTQPAFGVYTYHPACWLWRT
jgi:type II secretory pathway pseudopilin PulG